MYNFRNIRELNRKWLNLKIEMALELTEKVQFQMPFYGHFSDVKIDQEDVFANMSKDSQKQLQAKTTTDATKVER
jgi:hypothetical protein